MEKITLGLPKSSVKSIKFTLLPQGWGGDGMGVVDFLWGQQGSEYGLSCSIHRGSELFRTAMGGF